MRSGASLRPSNLLSVSGSPWRGSHYALYEHGRGKRAHPIYQRVLAQGRSRARAAYQSCLFKKVSFLEEGKRLLSAGWRVKDESKSLGRGAAGAHLPDVDQQPPGHRHCRFFLEHFITATEYFPPLHHRGIVGLEKHHSPHHLDDQSPDPGRTHFGNRAQALVCSSRMLPGNKPPKAANFAPIGKAMVITDLPIQLHHTLGPEAFGQSFFITLD